MAERVTARALLGAAKSMYDDPATGLSQAANKAWRDGFVSGAEWMRLALTASRGEPPSGSAKHLNLLGAVKYGLASTAAGACIGVTLWAGQPVIFLLVIPVFYAVEAQMVFLFPAVLDRTPHPFRAARRLTVQAGGTFTVMRIVIPLAVVMLFGGLAGQGFVRSWCLGCLAVCLWYEQIRMPSLALPTEAVVS